MSGHPSRPNPGRQRSSMCSGGGQLAGALCAPGAGGCDAFAATGISRSSEPSWRRGIRCSWRVGRPHCCCDPPHDRDSGHWSTTHRVSPATSPPRPRVDFPPAPTDTSPSSPTSTPRHCPACRRVPSHWGFDRHHRSVGSRYVWSRSRCRSAKRSGLPWGQRRTLSR